MSAERKVNKAWERGPDGRMHEVDLEGQKRDAIRKFQDEKAEDRARLLREGPAVIPQTKLTAREKRCQDQLNAFVLGLWHATDERIRKAGLETREWPKGYPRNPSEFPKSWHPVILDGRFEVDPDHPNSATLDGLKKALDSIFYEVISRCDRKSGQVLAVARRPMVFYGWEDSRENSEVALMFRSAIVPSSVYLIQHPDAVRA